MQKAFLFLENTPSGTGWQIRPVLWAQPNLFTIPLLLEPTPEILEWLSKYECPKFTFGIDGKTNCMQMQRKLGYWPEPILVDIQGSDTFNFNDHIPF